MTVLIGLRCRDGGVVACDSQETRANYFRFWPKIGQIDEHFVLLGAGNPNLGEVLPRRLQAKFGEARRQGALDRPAAMTLIDEALMELAHEGGEEAMKERQLLIAGLAEGGEICLWAVDSGEVYVREMRIWECYGSGIDAAEMLMKDFYFPEITIEAAVPLLAYVVRAVGEVCLDCGGPISVAVVDNGGVRKLSQREVDNMLDKTAARFDRLRKELPKRILRGEGIAAGELGG